MVAAWFHARNGDVLPFSGQGRPVLGSKNHLGWGRRGRGPGHPSDWVFPCAPSACTAISVQGKGEEKGKKKTAWHEFRKLSSSHIWFLYFKVN